MRYRILAISCWIAVTTIACSLPTTQRTTANKFDIETRIETHGVLLVDTLITAAAGKEAVVEGLGREPFRYAVTVSECPQGLLVSTRLERKNSLLSPEFVLAPLEAGSLNIHNHKFTIRVVPDKLNKTLPANSARCRNALSGN